MSVVNEPQLAMFVKSFGDTALTAIGQYVFLSSLVNTIVITGAIIALVNLGMALHKETAPTSSLMFFLAWAGGIMVHGKP